MVVTPFFDNTDYDLDHEFYCADQDQVHPIIVREVDGVTLSVKLFDKWFSEEEIERLKTLNGSSNETTYEIFKYLDAKTRACEHSWIEYESWNN